MSSSSSSHRDQPVKDAVQGLVQGIHQQLDRYEKKRGVAVTTQQRQHIQSILKHWEHCLVQLCRQQDSLQAGLDCLQYTLWPAVLQRLRSSSSRNSSFQAVTRLLQHVFHQVLRLHDGLILCQSGECRHVTDVRLVRRRPKQFQSQLATPAATSRTDGYTHLYAATATYTGTAWDEITNETAGLQERLWTAMKPFLPRTVQSAGKMSWWERLTDVGGTAHRLEALLQQIESRPLQSQFVSLSKTLPLQLRSALEASSFGGGTSMSSTMTLADKMEQWHVMVGKQVCKMDRRASDFQVLDVQGVLPDSYVTRQDWEPIMMSLLQQLDQETATAVGSSLASAGARQPKRRRRIIDSDEDSDQDAGTSSVPTQPNNSAEVAAAATVATFQTAVGGATGLRVRVHQQETSPCHQSRADGSSLPTASINEIKQKLGIDVHGLATAREKLEAEEAEATRAADLVDLAPVEVAGMYNDDNVDNNSSREQYELAFAQGLVRELERALKRVLRQGQDSVEIWDARERLRHAAMDAGNRLLWSSSDGDDQKGQRCERLGRAINYFSFSKSLVQEQQKLFELMTAGRRSNPVMENARIYCRNLILLLGQASVNTGVAKIELALCFGERDRERKIELRNAVQELENAQTNAVAMESTARADVQETSGDEKAEAHLDVFSARHLKTLAQRWQAAALWHQGHWRQSFKCFESAGCSHLQTGELAGGRPFQDEALFEKEMEVRIESYHAWTTLADLSSRTLEKATVGNLREYPEMYDEIFEHSMEALRHAASASESIWTLFAKNPGASTWDTTCAENGLLSAKDLTISASELQSWWTRRKDFSTRKIQPTENNVLPTLPRNDLLADGSSFGESAPTRRLILTETARRQRKKPKLKTGAGYSNIGACTYESEQSAPEKIQYRKWGDQLLPQTVDVSGKKVPKIPYPSCAPEMPQELKDLLREWQSSAQ